MRSPKVFICLILGLVLPLTHAFAATDPADQFLNAYFLIQEGDAAEKANDANKAKTKFKDALDILKDLKKTDPSWNPQIVEYRINYCTKHLGPAASEGGADTMSAAFQALPTGTELEKIQKLEEELKSSREENVKLRGQITGLEGDLNKIKSETSEKLALLEQQNKEMSEKLAQAQKDYTAMQQRAETAEAKVAEIDKIRAQFAQMQNAADKLDARNKELEAHSKDMSQELADLRQQLKAAAGPLDRQLRDLQSKNKDMAKKLARSEAIASSMQSSVVSSKAKLHEYEGRLDKLTAENSKLAKENKDIPRLREELAKLKEQLSSAQSENTDKLNDLRRQNDQLSRKLNDSEKTVAALQKASVGSNESVKEIQELRKQLNTARASLETAQEKNAQLESKSKEYQKQLDTLKTRAAAPIPQPETKADDARYREMQKNNERLQALLKDKEEEQARQKVAQEKTTKEMTQLQEKYESLQQQLNTREATEKPPKAEEQALLKQPAPVTGPATPETPVASTPATPVETTPIPVVPTPSTDTPAAVAPKSDDADIAKQAAVAATAPTPAPPAVADVPKETSNLPPEQANELKEGQALFEERKYSEAATKFQAVLDKNPNNTFALSNLAVAQYQQGNLADAQKTIEHCITVAPEDSYAYSVLGVIQYKQGKFDQAIAALTKSLAYNPKNAEAHNYLGITCSQKGWQTAAEQELRKAIDLNPNYAEAHFNLAVVYATQTPPSPDLAKEHYKKAQELGMSPDPELEKLLNPKPAS